MSKILREPLLRFFLSKYFRQNMSVFVIFVALIALAIDIINVGQKSKFWPKIEILVKNKKIDRNFRRKLEFAFKPNKSF